MHRRFLAAAVPVVALALVASVYFGHGGIGAAAQTPAAAPDIGPVPLAQLPRVAIPKHYTLAFTIDPTQSRFSGHAEIDVDFTKPLRALYIDGNGLAVKTVFARAGGKTIAASYSQVDKSGVALLTFAGEVPAGAVKLVFDYDAPFDGSLAGLYKVSVRGDAYAFTQFEDIDARRAFPGFDEPGFKTPFDVTITAPEADKVVANTRVVNDTGAGHGMTRWTFETTKPLPTYLVAMAVGPLDIVNVGEIPANKYRHDPLPLRGVAARGMGPKLKYALSLTPAIIDTLENYYGVAYPYQKLDILAVPDFSAGAMENAGAVTFREQLLLMGDDAPMDQKRSSLDVQAHELAHQWFGDYVTPTWWDNIWLNESFATWMEYKISAMVRPDEEFGRSTLNAGLTVMRLDELPSARQIHNPVNNPDDIANAFDQITYAKGGAVLAMFEAYVGPEEWQKGIHAYLTKFAYKNASAQDFIGTIAEATHHPEIVAAFNDFIDQPGIPDIHVETKCNAGAADAAITESMYAPIGVAVPARSWHIPACLDVDGKRICSIVAPPVTHVSLGSACPARIFPNADSAGYYRFHVGDWSKLIATAAQSNAAEQANLARDVDAAMRAGQASAGDYFATIHALARVAQWDVVETGFSLRDLRVTGVIAPADVKLLQSFVRRNFGSRLVPLGLATKPGESVADTLLREHLVALLVEEGRDPALIASLAKAAHAWVDSDGRNSGGIAPEILSETLRAGVFAEGTPFADRLLEKLKKTGDEFVTQQLIHGISASDDPATLAKLLDLSLTPAIRIGDVRTVLRDLAAETWGRPVLWNWFKANTAGIKQRMSSRGLAGGASIQSNACDVQSKTEMDAFLAPLAAQSEGLPRLLRQADNRIDRCIAFRDAKAAEIAAALRKAE